MHRQSQSFPNRRASWRSDIEENGNFTMAYTESLHQFFTIFFFIFGSLLGSFSNVVILRMASSKSVIFPPSACPRCDHQLHAIDLIPVFSWLMLRGKCRYCQVPISCQYPLVEASISLIVGLSFYKHGLTAAFIVLAGRSVIWFVASVLFLRNEVKQPDPFLWAAIYFVYLNFPVGGCPFIDKRTLALPFIALLSAMLAGWRNKITNIAAWGCLTLIFTFSLLPKFALFASIPLLLVATLNFHPRTEKAAAGIFFVLQLSAIAFGLQ